MSLCLDKNRYRHALYYCYCCCRCYYYTQYIRCTQVYLHNVDVFSDRYVRSNTRTTRAGSRRNFELQRHTIRRRITRTRFTGRFKKSSHSFPKRRRGGRGALRSTRNSKRVSSTRLKDVRHYSSFDEWYFIFRLKALFL